MDDKICLAGEQPFGVGGRRSCYVHPSNSNLCIKVLRQDALRTVRVRRKRLIPAAMKREYNNNTHEAGILEALQKKIGPTMSDHLPWCHGFTATDQGEGLVLDLIRDADGLISRSLRELITEGMPLENLRPAFDALGEFLQTHCVLTRQLLDHNIVAQHRSDGTWRLVIIDGLGDPAWFSLSALLPSFARRRIQSRLLACWARMEQFASRGGVTEEMRRTSSWDQGILRHRGLPVEAPQRRAS